MGSIKRNDSNPPGWGSTLWNFASNALTISARAVGVFASDYIMGRSLTPIMARNGICMANFMPEGSLSTINTINRVLIRPKTMIQTTFNLNDGQISNSIAPALEEFQFRYLLQQVALRDIPQALLNKYFPDNHYDLNTAPIKVLRALVTALIFTTLHFQYADCENGGGFDTFLGSLIYSSLIEVGESAVFTATLHLLWNQLTPSLDRFIYSA